MSNRQRPHKPDELGPRLYRNHNDDICIDLRPWGGGRKTVRDPSSSPHWPRRGRKPETEREAARWTWDYVAHVEGKTAAPSARFKELSHATRAFLADRKGRDPYNTFKARRTAVRHLNAEFGQSAPVKSILPEDVHDLTSRLIQEGYSPRTIRSYVQGFKQFFEWVGMDSMTDSIEVPKDRTEGVTVWTDIEIAKLRAAAGPGDRLIVEALLCTGARVGEGWALRWEDFDAVNKIVRIRRQVTPGDSGNGTKPTKSGRARVALVHPDFWRWYEPGAEGPLFEPSARTTRTKTIKAILVRAGLKKTGVLAHVFRHTYARRFLSGGGSLEALQVFLGHSSIMTTQQYYGHFAAPAAVRIGRMALYGDPAQEVAQETPTDWALNS